jgi:hypothetical protein
LLASDPSWLRTDTMTEAVRSLERAVEALVAARADAYQYKWALHALQLSSQNFMLLTFTFADRGALDRRWWDEWEQAFAGSTPYPEREPRTTFRQIYKQFKRSNPQFQPLANSCGAALHDAIGMRDGFEHMEPKGWSIDVRRIRAAAAAVVRVIRFIVSERKCYPAIAWDSDEARSAVEELVATAEAATATA